MLVLKHSLSQRSLPRGTKNRFRSQATGRISGPAAYPDAIHAARRLIVTIGCRNVNLTTDKIASRRVVLNCASVVAWVRRQFSKPLMRRV